MKFNLSKLLILSVCLSIVGVSSAANAADDVIRVNMTTGYMEKHPVVQRTWIPWTKEVKEKTNGKLEIVFFNPNTLCPEREHFEATKKGQVGIGHQITGMNQGRLPVSAVLDMPNIMTNSLAASEAYWRVFESTPEMQKEYDGIKILAIHSSAPNQFDMAKGQITNLREIKGKKLLTVSGDGARILRALGASPMVMPGTDFYLSLSRNMADGCMLPMAPLRSFKISDALTSITLCSIRMDSFWMGMNQALYDSLPADCKKVIDETTGLAMSLRIGQSLYDGNEEDRVGLEKDGIKMNQISAQERQKWVDLAVPPMRENWFKQMKQRKFNNAQQIYDNTQKIFKESQAKWAHLG